MGYMYVCGGAVGGGGWVQTDVDTDQTVLDLPCDGSSFSLPSPQSERLTNNEQDFYDCLKSFSPFGYHALAIWEFMRVLASFSKIDADEGQITLLRLSSTTE